MTEPVPVIPLEAAEVGLAQPRSSHFQVIEDQSDLRILPITLRQIHASAIQIQPSLVCLGIGASFLRDSIIPLLIRVGAGGGELYIGRLEFLDLGRDRDIGGVQSLV